jgi:sulfate permease
MDIMLSLLFLSFISAVMIGGNCSYVMAAPFGSGVLTKKRALLLYVLFIFLGSILAGDDVAQSLNTSIIGVINPELGAISLISILICILLANVMKVPLSSSEMTIGAIAGVGIFFGSLISGSLLDFYISWIFGALLCFFISYIATIVFNRKNVNLNGALLTAVGCFFAFSIGANNVGNAIFPLIGMLSLPSALFFGGIALVAGGLVFSGRTMEKLGKEVTEIDVVSGFVASLTAAVALMVMSFSGLPAPAAHFYTLSIFGVGVAKGRKKMGLKAVLQIVAIWIVSPLLAIGISYGILALIY